MSLFCTSIVLSHFSACNATATNKCLELHKNRSFIKIIAFTVHNNDFNCILNSF